ncbi:MAG: hypothetical protein C4339_04585 [Nitrososphaerota archaeon]
MLRRALGGFEDLWIWKRLGDRLPWYYAVATNRMPAKYLLCRRIPLSQGLDLKRAEEAELWQALEEGTRSFLDLWARVRRGELRLGDLPKARPSLLDLCVELTRRMLTHCNFCRWNCRVDRSGGAKHGTCQLESTSRVASYFHHPGEELVFRGTRGSGTIFFTSCNMRCAFCLPPDALVLTKDGPVAISELYRAAGSYVRRQQGLIALPDALYVYTYKGRPARATKVFRHGYRGKLVTVKPLYGPPLSFTPEHEVVIYSPSEGQLKQARAAELSKGDLLLMPRVSGWQEPLQALSPMNGAEAPAPNGKARAACLQLEYGLAVPVAGVTCQAYEGPVYNLEVDDFSHTYVANFFAVGNCQNGDISTDKDNGIPVSPRLVALMAWQLRMEGCHNINWVGGEPTVHLHTIVEAISLLGSIRPSHEELAYIGLAKAEDGLAWPLRAQEAHYEGELNAPQLWNSNFFMSEESLKILRLLIDVWLPDFKFGPGRCALLLARTPWYWETVTKNHGIVHEWGEDMVIRHLIMPGHVECCTKPVLDWIASHVPEVPVNIMDQYHPDNYCDPRSPKFDPRYAPMARRPSRDEILEAYRYARQLGLIFEALSFEDKNMTGLRI